MSLEIRQQLLNESVAHVRKQAQPSAFPAYANQQLEARCRYRDDSGRLSCAAGIFIKRYNRYMETKRFRGITGPDAVVDYSDSLDPRAVQEAQFVEEVLQLAHDRAATDSIVNKENFLERYEWHLAECVHWWNNARPDSIVVPA